ncbi:MAG: trypsin-like serine protease [Candidatus Nitrohelix vancouverensis]|uniref:Trypsin-like serine protease n=1 Tax=Candidatus Nitrohelix vancouverensis TaxID=2705534 RepID=A0A7T0C4M3_9BACT|nr:MAG: trypsin-like serine protease [Candidatus Nitrohelix vancouverensis]
MGALTFENWDTIKFSLFGRPMAQDLDFNRPENRSSGAPLATRDEEITTRVYDNNRSAVVNIASTALSMNFWRQIVPTQGQGTGVIIDQQGYILTNNHVVEGAQKITVTLDGTKRADAVLIGKAPSTDLAVIKIPSRFVDRVARLGNSDLIRVGQKAIAIGNPFGLSQTLTSGVISALDRHIQNEDGSILENLIQTDAAINPGNSGGPLLNSSGEVVGINTAIFSMSGGYQGIGFAIPINRARQVASQLITSGKFAVPWLGVSGLPLNPELSKAIGVDFDKGVVVVDVVMGSPAHKGGVQGGRREVSLGNMRLAVDGDIILGLNDRKIETMNDLTQTLSQYKIGDSVQLKVWRNNRLLALNLILQEKPV